MATERYTVGQVSRMICVAKGVVRSWLDTGRLSSHTDPVTGERWVSRTDLDAFTDAHGMPPVNGRDNFAEIVAELPIEVRADLIAEFEADSDNVVD